MLSIPSFVLFSFVLLIIFKFASFLLINHSLLPFILVLQIGSLFITLRLNLALEILFLITFLLSNLPSYSPPHLTLLPLLLSTMPSQQIATQNNLSNLLLLLTFILLYTRPLFLITFQPLLLLVKPTVYQLYLSMD